jgi:hypothetical protein
MEDLFFGLIGIASIYPFSVFNKKKSFDKPIYNIQYNHINEPTGDSIKIVESSIITTTTTSIITPTTMTTTPTTTTTTSRFISKSPIIIYDNIEFDDYNLYNPIDKPNTNLDIFSNYDENISYSLD